MKSAGRVVKRDYLLHETILGKKYCNKEFALDLFSNNFTKNRAREHPRHLV